MITRIAQHSVWRVRPRGGAVDSHRRPPPDRSRPNRQSSSAVFLGHRSTGRSRQAFSSFARRRRADRSPRRAATALLRSSARRLDRDVRASGPRHRRIEQSCRQRNSNLRAACSTVGTLGYHQCWLSSGVAFGRAADASATQSRRPRVALFDRNSTRRGSRTSRCSLRSALRAGRRRSSGARRSSGGRRCGGGGDGGRKRGRRRGRRHRRRRRSAGAPIRVARAPARRAPIGAMPMNIMA